MLPDWFDLRSAGLMVSLCALFMAVVLASQASMGRQVPGFIAWLTLAVLAPLGLTLNSLQGSLSEWLVFPVGLTLLNVGVFSGWIGARQFMGRAPHFWTIGVVAAVSAIGGWYFSMVAPNANGRVLIISPIHAWATGATAWLLLQRDDEDLRFALRFAGLPMALFAIISVGRTAVALFGPPMVSGFARSPLNTTTYLVGSSALLCTYAGLVMCINAISTREIRREADHDTLTGLINRHGLKRRFDGWHQRHPAGAKILLIDIDRFKRVNDVLGHPEGDRLLVGFADIVRRLAEPPILAGRLGGDEFAVLTPSAERAKAFAADASRQLEQYCAKELTGLGPPAPTLSIGMADVTADLSTTLKAADTALYRAKEGGRNRLAELESPE